MTKSKEEIAKIVTEIREKIKNNRNYLRNRCAPEFQNDIKKYGFISSSEFAIFLVENGIAPDPAEVNRKDYKKVIENAGCKTLTEYNNYCAKKGGYEDNAERQREYRYNTGQCMPMSENKDCAQYLGIHIAERVLAHIFKKENVERKPYGHKGYDFICGKGKKVDVKSSSFHSYMNGWLFQINNNEIAEYFLLLALSERYYGVVADDEKLKPMCIWLVPKDAIFIRRGGTKEFWDRVGIWIKNTPEGLREFEKYELKEGLEHLIECCEK